MSFVEFSTLLRSEASSLDNWVPTFRGNMIFSTPKCRNVFATAASFRRKRNPQVGHCETLNISLVLWCQYGRYCDRVTGYLVVNISVNYINPLTPNEHIGVVPHR